MKTDFFSEKKYINAYLVCVFLFLLVGLFQSWNVAFSILNLCLISAIMSIGINIQWGNSGIVNFGVMGFAAIGGLCGVLISMPPTLEVWKDGTAVILIILFSFLISGILVKVLSIALLIAVGIVLILGIGTLFKGGETSKKYSNKLMQLRVILQFIAIIALVGFAYFFKN